MGKRDAANDPPGKPTIHRRRGKGLLHKKESVKEFTVRTKIKYASCMDPLLEGDRLKDGKLSELCCKNTYESITNFNHMTPEAIDQHLYDFLDAKRDIKVMNICANVRLFLHSASTGNSI